MKSNHNPNLLRYQKESIQASERKILEALSLQDNSKPLNISKLAKDASISRTQLTKRYRHLYANRIADSSKTLDLKQEIFDLEKANSLLKKELTSLQKINLQLTDRLVELNTVIQHFTGQNAFNPRGYVKIGVIRTANRNMSGHRIGTSPDSKSVDIRTLCADDRYIRTA